MIWIKPTMLVDFMGFFGIKKKNASYFKKFTVFYNSNFEL